MPLANIYLKDESVLPYDKLGKIADILAAELTTEDLLLDSEHISLHVIRCTGRMLGEIELHIVAHSFPCRVKAQDQICANIRRSLEGMFGESHNVRVWLSLSEMGYGYDRLMSR